MKKVTVAKFFWGVMLFTLGVVTRLAAQTLTDSPQRQEQNRSGLSGAPGREVIESIIKYKPGETIDRHFHHDIEAVYVIQGASAQAPGQAPVTIHAGMQEILVDGGQFVGQLRIEQLDDFFIALHGNLSKWVLGWLAGLRRR